MADHHRNEGDEIVFLALSQFGISLPNNITSLNQLTADVLISLVVSSLALISNGTIQFSTALPQNIASRHRICTEIASKVKEVGFPGECGYNQLLYPVESQTRPLLTWLVQHLPRSEDERVEEVLGANALLNRRIMQSLVEWKKQVWLHPSSCFGKPPRNVYGLNSLRTSNMNLTTCGILSIFRDCENIGTSVVPSILERHTLEMIEEVRYASQLDDDNDDELGVGVRNRRHGKRGRKINAGIKSILRKALSGGTMDNDTLRSSKRSIVHMVDMSLQNIIKTIRNNALADGHDGNNTNDRKTRFQSSAELSYDSIAIMGGTSNNVSLSSAARTVEALAGIEQEDREARKIRQEQEEKERMDELEVLREEIQNSTASLQNMEYTRTNSISKMRQLESELSALSMESENLEREILVKKKTLAMAPQALENICRLQEICGSLSSKLLQLAQEWETHRRPLIDALRAKKRDKAQRRIRCRQMADETKRLREEMVGMVAELKDKQERVDMLAQEVEDLPKNLTRALYTSRILDIINSLTKQNVEIDKITSDIHTIQKTINHTTSALSRADAVAEELIYSAANGTNSEKAMVDTYRRLRNMRSKFEELIDTVTKVGQQEKLARDLETKIEAEQSRMSSNNIQQIQQDLHEIQAENDQLIATIKQLVTS